MTKIRELPLGSSPGFPSALFEVVCYTSSNKLLIFNEYLKEISIQSVILPFIKFIDIGFDIYDETDEMMYFAMGISLNPTDQYPYKTFMLKKNCSQLIGVM